MTGGAAADILLRRIRDPLAIGTARADVLSLLSYAQLLVNLDARLIMQETIVTLDQRRLIYDIATKLGAVGRIEEVIYGGRRLDRMTLPQLVSFDRAWFRRFAEAPEAWVPLGRRLFVIYPGVENATTTVTVKTTSVIGDVGEATELVVSNADEDALLDLVELLLLLRIRIIENLKPAFERTELALANVRSRGAIR